MIILLINDQLARWLGNRAWRSATLSPVPWEAADLSHAGIPTLAEDVLGGRSQERSLLITVTEQ